MMKAGLQRRLEKLEGRSLAHTLAAQPEGESKRLFLARLAAIRQRLEAARDRGEYVPTVDVGEVKARLRAVLEDMRNKRA
jgi:hypothetical protein